MYNKAILFGLVALFHSMVVPTSSALAGHRNLDGDMADQLAQVESGELKTARVEWWGVNSTNATEILQNAINSKASTIIIGKAGSPWITEPLFLRSNLEIVFEDGAVLKARIGSYQGHDDNVFYAECCSNITIRGSGTIVMNKADYQNPKKYKRAEWRDAIDLRACDTVTIKGLKIVGTGGDGIYLGAKPVGLENGWPVHGKNIVIDSCHISQAHRNAISVIAVENLRISNCELVNTSGVSPQAGIDFEPNFANEPLANCLVENCMINGNESYGVLMAAWNISGVAKPIDIVVKDCEIKGNGRNIVLIKGNKEEVVANPSTGMIKFDRCQIGESGVRSLEFRDIYTDGYQVVFQDCRIVDPVVNNPKFSPILMDISKTMTKNIGGCITFTNTCLADPQNRELVQEVSRAEGDVAYDRMNGTLIYNGEAINMADYAYPKDQ